MLPIAGLIVIIAVIAFVIFNMNKKDKGNVKS